LVVRQLEKDWENMLAEADRLERDYQRFRDSRPATHSSAERDAIRALAENLPAVWHGGITTVENRKETLRTLIESITVAVIGDSERVNVTIRWAGNHETNGQAVRPVARIGPVVLLPPTAGPHHRTRRSQPHHPADR
jgi:hypothetical protein